MDGLVSLFSNLRCPRARPAPLLHWSLHMEESGQHLHGSSLCWSHAATPAEFGRRVRCVLRPAVMSEDRRQLGAVGPLLLVLRHLWYREENPHSQMRWSESEKRRLAMFRHQCNAGERWCGKIIQNNYSIIPYDRVHIVWAMLGAFVWISQMYTCL